MGEPVKQRLLNVLYMLYSKFGPILKFTNHDLANLAGTTTETANRVMGRLRHQGIIETHYGEVHIHNHKELENLSRGPFAI
jgi:CRP-like cAMP-binding protein